GGAMLVNRWRAHRWQAGVLDLQSGALRWFDFGVELPLYGRSLQWLSDTAFVAIALDPDDAPLHVKLNASNPRRLQEAWARQAAGREPSFTIMGSGRARTTAPRRDRRLVQVNLASGEETTLATGGFFDMELSPSGRYLAALGEAEPIGLVQSGPVQMPAPTRRRALTLVDLVSGAVSDPCATCTTLIRPLAWSPKDDRLLVFQHPATKSETTGALTVVDARTGRASPVGATLTPAIDYGDEGFAVVEADWIGSTPIVLARAAGDGRADWRALTGGEGINLTRRLPAAPTDLAIVDDHRLLAIANGAVWRIDDRGRASVMPLKASRWIRPAALGLGLRPLVAPLRGADPWAEGPGGLVSASGRVASLADTAGFVARSGSRTVVEHREPDGVRRLSVVDAAGRERDLIVLNADLARLDLGAARSFETRSPSGQSLKHWLYMPPGWRDGDAPPPVIVVPYPGSAPQGYPSRFAISTNNITPNPPLLAAQGYAVLAPALPRDRRRGEPAEGLADEILAAVDAAAERGLIDADRLALWGHSFGGYAALVTATQTGRFKAIVAQSGLSDAVANWAAMDPHFMTSPEDGAPNANMLGYHETGQGALFGTPWDALARFERNSPLLQADRITSPLMLIYADQDFVPLAQGQAMFNALYRQDKDVTLISLFGERHIPKSPANIRGVYDAVLPWLADRLSLSSDVGDGRVAKRPSQ
ncbi:MAG: S9 family peptidase, partial [Caulobacterales bacterium]|nr:S9 family peptidase [Caulobacterales bacterium]